MSALPITSLIARYASAASHPVRSGLGGARPSGALDVRLRALDAACQRWLVAHSIAILRVSLGAVFLAFGALKFFPGVSPAQDLVERTTDALTFGLVPGAVALVAVAAMECIVGICLVSGRAVPLAVCLLGVLLVGILSPLVLLTGRLFAGPHGAPTLEGQYVLKDVILVGAGLVVAATCRGAGLTDPAEHERG